MSSNPQSSVNPFAAHQTILKERLSTFLATLHPMLRPDVARSLEGEGKLLSQSRTKSNEPYPDLPAGAWGLVTLLVGQSIFPNIDSLYATSVAVAVECFVCAID